MTQTPWEPPLAGTEADHLLGALDRLRATFRYKVDGLDADGLTRRVGASALTLGGLLSHLAAVEDHYSTVRLSGEPMSEPWQGFLAAARDGAPDGDPEEGDPEEGDPEEGDPEEGDPEEGDDFRLARTLTPQQLYGLWDGAVERSRRRFTAAVDGAGLGQLVAVHDDEGRHASLRRLLFDLVEEYGRHTGHADLLREAVDGRVGEDPPAGWTPVSQG
jgi:hypothetical protein